MSDARAPSRVQVALPAPVMVPEEQRLEQMRSYVVLALIDGHLSPEERQKLEQMAEELRLPQKVVAEIIESELAKALRRSLPGVTPPAAPTVPVTRAPSLSYLQLCAAALAFTGGLICFRWSARIEAHAPEVLGRAVALRFLLTAAWPLGTVAAVSTLWRRGRVVGWIMLAWSVAIVLFHPGALVFVFPFALGAVLVMRTHRSPSPRPWPIAGQLALTAFVAPFLYYATWSALAGDARVVLEPSMPRPRESVAAGSSWDSSSPKPPSWRLPRGMPSSPGRTGPGLPMPPSPPENLDQRMQEARMAQTQQEQQELQQRRQGEMQRADQRMQEARMAQMQQELQQLQQRETNERAAQRSQPSPQIYQPPTPPVYYRPSPQVYPPPAPGR